MRARPYFALTFWLMSCHRNNNRGATLGPYAIFCFWLLPFGVLTFGVKAVSALFCGGPRGT